MKNINKRDDLFSIGIFGEPLPSSQASLYRRGRYSHEVRVNRDELTVKALEIATQELGKRAQKAKRNKNDIPTCVLEIAGLH